MKRYFLCITLYSLCCTLCLATAPEVDNNIGVWTDNFTDQLGTVVANSSNVDFDVFAGTVSLAPGQNSGTQQSVVISPPSFDSWLDLCLDASYSSDTDLSISVLDAATDNPLSGYNNIPIGNFTNGCYDISGIDINAYPELKIQINHTRGNTAPLVKQLQVTWNPRTFLLFDKIAPPSVLAGQEFRYQIRVSANFVDAQDVVIYDQLPATLDGTVIYEPGEDYGQSDNPTVGQISDNGQYTAAGTVINGVTIPPNSVYWSFDEIEAGVSSILQFYVQSPNGTLDGTIWENSAQVSVSNGDNQTTAPVQTVIRSTPAPGVIKESTTLSNPTANNIYPIQGTNYIIPGDIITYSISGVNSYAAEGRERMYNTVIWDDLSDLIDNGLIVGAPFNISGGGIFTTSPVTVNGINIPANSIYWDKGTFNPGAGANESFQVEIASNPTMQDYTNFVYIDSDQTNVQEDQITVNPIDLLTGLPGSGCGGCKQGYFLSYSSGEQDRNCGSGDGSVAMNFGDPLQYRYSYANCGGGELEEVVFYDMVPPETRFVNASFIDPTGLLTGEIYYYEDLSNTFTNSSSPPPFDWTAPTTGGWTAVKPIDTDDPNQTIWVAWKVAGLTSPYVNSNPARPVSATVALDVIPTDPGGNCSEVFITNNILTHVYQIVPQGGGAPQVSPDNSSPIYAASSTDITQARSPIGQFSLGLDNGNITGNLFAPAEVTFSIDLCNRDANTSAPFIETELELVWSGVMINGQTMLPDFIDVSGGEVINFDPANGSVTLKLGAMIPGDCNTATLTIFVPEGIIDLESVTVGANATGIAPFCDPVTVSTNRTVPVTTVPVIQVYKDDILNVIGSGDRIEYDLFFRNIGEGPSTNTWVLDRIPFKTTFVEAYGENGEQVWFTDKLPPDMPANQISVAFPVDFSTVSANFTLGILDDNGTPTDYTDDIWTSPFGDQTTWIAFKVDDPTLMPNQLPVDINFRKTSFVVQNDDDGTGPNTNGSPEGTVIFNEEVIFSDQNLMAVGNEVRTTIEDFPGLILSKRSSKEVVNSGEAFDWIVDYRNNSAFQDDIVTITDNIPSEFILNSVSHEWNAAAGGGGVSDISGDSNVVITANPDGSTSVEVRIAGSPGFRNNLLTDEGGTLYFNVQAKPEVPCGALLFNEVTGFSSNSGGDALSSDDDPVTLFNPDVFLAKSVSNQESNIGDTLSYTLSFGNRSIVEAPGVIIRDTLPAGFTYVSGSSNILSLTTNVSEPSIAGNVLEWNDITVSGYPTGTLPAQFNNNYLTYRVVANGSQGQEYTNRAGISTTGPEKPEYANTDSVTVLIPHPDPAITKNGPAVSTAGESIVWELTYLNTRNSDAENVYILESLPDANGNGADVTFTGTTAQGPGAVSIFYSSATGTAPVFDIANPTANGWSSTPTSPVNFIAYSIGTLPAEAGPYSIQVSATLIDAVSGNLPAPGTNFLNRTEIFTSSVDSNPDNNEDEVITRTPGIDLSISKTGSSEGTFPGLRPGDALSYSLVIRNEGTLDAYGVRVEDILPDNFIPDSGNFTDFTTVEVTDDTGSPLAMLDVSGNPVAFSVPVTTMGSPAPGSTITWFLGTDANSGDNDYYRNLAIPVGGQVAFTISGHINENAADGDRACNSIQVFYEGQVSNTVPEDYLVNNIDSSKVNIWRPDVTVKKTVMNVSDSSEIWTEAGEILEYTLEYNNIGNADADDVCIQEVIPEGTSLIPGSISLPPGAEINYTPNESNPTNFEICLPVLPAPPNFDGESAPYSGTPSASDPFDGTDPESIACADRRPILAEINTNAFPGSANAYTVDAGDVDGDGDLDIVMGSQTTTEQLWLNDGTGNFTLGYVFPTNRGVQDVSFGDFDGDGSLDVVFATGGSTGGGFGYMNDGAGNYTPMSTGFPGNQVGSVAVGDFNADGLDDIAFGNWGSTAVYTSNGDGSFTGAGSVSGTFRIGYLVSGDYNNDGYDDLGQQCVGGCGAVISINNQNGTWTNTAIPGTTNHRGSIEPGDFNGDGNQDYATGRQIYFGDGAGNMTAQQVISGSSGYNGDVMDIDGDGDLDIIQGNTSNIRYYSNNGNGTFSGETVLSGINSEDAVFGDFDGDGYPDAVITSSDTEGLVLITNTSSAPYLTNSYYETVIQASNITGWNRLLATHTIEEGASISYTIYNSTADDDGDVTNDAPLFGPTSLENGFEDISAIPAANDNLILRVDFTSDGAAKACLHNWTATYISPDIPNIKFRVRLDNPVQAGQTTIDNDVIITTTTPEIDTTNNDDEDDINIRLTDLAIVKSVDRTAVQAPNDETITYTLDWQVLGPQSAINARVYDVLPPNVAYQSAVPAPTFVGTTLTGRDSLVWDLGAELNVGAAGSITITSQETSAVLGDNLTNITWIGNDRQETDYDNNNDDVVTVVGDFANVYIEKDGPSVISINETGQYQLAYGNNGNIAADNVMITDNLPTGFTPTMTNNPGCIIMGQNISCTLGTLSVGATGSILIDFQVANDPGLVGQTLLNIAEIETTTPETDISDNEDDHEVPIFLLELAAISGTVWHDDNRDGIIDPTENGIESVMIILTGLDIFNQSVQDTAWTDENGQYSFPGLVPGTYNVEEVQPEGWLTITATGSDSVTDIGDVTETSASPQTVRTDEGSVGTGTVSPVNESYNSITLNGGDRGIEYNFGEDLGILGDTVWVDYNINGLQDANEPPVSGVTVNLYQDKDMDGVLNPVTDSLVATTLTNSLGAYLFEDLFADNYFIDFDLSTLPDSINRVTTQNAGGDDTLDSDADPQTGYTELISLPAGGEDLTWDMGVYGDLLIGNYVWIDTNADGIQDPGETPLQGINVSLFTTTGESLATVQTDAAGLYYFNTDTLLNAGIMTADSVLRAETQYYIVVGTGGQYDSNSGILNYNSTEYQLTIDSTGTNATDSDATLANGLGLGFDGLPYTLITTPLFGQADTTFDFGFITASYDYGDLPDSGAGTSNGNYETSLASGGPSHLIVPGLLLGTLIDEENNGQPDGDAEGDDNGDGNDDEDGLVLPRVLLPGGSGEIMITASNTTGDTAFVRVWVDWNADGDFDDPGELVINDNDGSGALAGTYNITAPNDAPIGENVGVRVRLSNQNNLSSTGPSNSGEVEDYLLTLGSFDYPDLPNNCVNPPCHIVSSDIYLGAGVTSETLPDLSSNIDQDEDDGLILGTNFNMTPGNAVRIPLQVYNNTGEIAYVGAWADWNNDGDFDDPSEQIANTSYDPVSFNGTFIASLPVSIPASVSSASDIRFRFRVSTEATTVSSPCGTTECTAVGEVEDYLLRIQCPAKICTPVQLITN